MLGVRLHNPVWGSGSPLAPPVELEIVDDGVIGRCTLDLSFEGPPAYAHGGVSAMLLDQVLGLAVAAAGQPSVTRGLRIDYVRPVPLETPIEIRCRLEETRSDGFVARGTITAEEQVLARGEGLFVTLTRAQARRFFARNGGGPES